MPWNPLQQMWNMTWRREGSAPTQNAESWSSGGMSFTWTADAGGALTVEGIPGRPLPYRMSCPSAAEARSWTAVLTSVFKSGRLPTEGVFNAAPTVPYGGGGGVLVGMYKGRGAASGDATPTDAMQNAARRFFELKKRGAKGTLSHAEARAQGIKSGRSMAKALASGRALTEAEIRRGNRFWIRHAKNAKVDPGKKPSEDRGYVAGLAWGGPTAAPWFAARYRALEPRMSKGTTLLIKGPKKIKGPVAFLTDKQDGHVFPVSTSDPKAQEALKSPRHREIVQKIHDSTKDPQKKAKHAEYLNSLQGASKPVPKTVHATTKNGRSYVEAAPGAHSDGDVVSWGGVPYRVTGSGKEYTVTGAMRPLKPGELTFRRSAGGKRNQGSSDDGYQVGQMIKNSRNGKWYRVVAASSQYIPSDGRSFGYDMFSGWGHDAIARPATEEEAAPFVAWDESTKAKDQGKRDLETIHKRILQAPLADGAGHDHEATAQATKQHERLTLATTARGASPELRIGDTTITAFHPGNHDDYRVSARSIPKTDDLERQIREAHKRASATAERPNVNLPPLPDASVFEQNTRRRYYIEPVSGSPAQSRSSNAPSGAPRHYTQTGSVARQTTSQHASAKLTFGKHNGKTLAQVAATDPSYLRWGAENLNNKTMRDKMRDVYEKHVLKKGITILIKGRRKKIPNKLIPQKIGKNAPKPKEVTPGKGSPDGYITVKHAEGEKGRVIPVWGITPHDEDEDTLEAQTASGAFVNFDKAKHERVKNSVEKSQRAKGQMKLFTPSGRISRDAQGVKRKREAPAALSKGTTPRQRARSIVLKIHGSTADPDKKARHAKRLSTYGHELTAPPGGGRYRRHAGKINFQGIPVAIEHEKGTMRPVAGGGQVRMLYDYGEIHGLGTRGVDGDKIDVYVGPNLNATHAYIVDQMEPDTGAFDEQKVMLGFDSEAAAKSAYCAQYGDATECGSVHPIPMADFKKMVRDRARRGQALTSRPVVLIKGK